MFSLCVAKGRSHCEQCHSSCYHLRWIHEECENQCNSHSLGFIHMYFNFTIQCNYKANKRPDISQGSLYVTKLNIGA